MIKCPNCGSIAQVRERSEVIVVTNGVKYRYIHCDCGCGCDFSVKHIPAATKITRMVVKK